MGKMRMEAGDWLGHGGMGRGGVLTVQVRAELGKHTAMLRERVKAMRRGRCLSMFRRRIGSCSFGY